MQLLIVARVVQIDKAGVHAEPGFQQSLAPQTGAGHARRMLRPTFAHQLLEVGRAAVVLEFRASRTGDDCFLRGHRHGLSRCDDVVALAGTGELHLLPAAER